MVIRRAMCIVLAAFIVLFALAGCGGGAAQTTTAAATTAAATTAAAAETTAAAAETTAAAATTTKAAETTTEKATTAAPVAATTEGERTPATISLLIMSSATTTIDPWRDTPVGQALAEITKVDLQIEYLVGSDVRQKASLLIAAGEYPDLMVTGDASGDFYAADAYVPLEGYLESLPNLSVCYTESNKKLMTQEDGHIYWLGGQPSENAVYPAAGYYLNMETLAANDYPIVKDFEEWQQIVIDYTKANPTYNGQPTIGFMEPTEAWRASAIQYGGSRFLVGYQNDGLTVVDPDTLEAKVIMDQDFQKQFVHMMFRMWNEGVADKEMFMQTDEQYQAKIGSGRVVGLYDQRSMIQNGIDALNVTAPERMLVAFPVVLPGVTTERYRGPRNFSGGSGLGITVSAKDPDRVAQFLDDMCTEEAQIIMRWGIEGEDYSVADDGTLQKTAEQWKQYTNAEFKQQRGIGQLGTFHLYPNLVELPNCKTIASPDNTIEFAQNAYSDLEKDFLSHYADRGYDTFVGWFNPSYNALYEPGWSIRQRIDTQDPRKVAGETALELTLEYIPKLVQAGSEDKFESIWQEFTGVLAALPLREYEELATQMIKESAPLYQ